MASRFFGNAIESLEKQYKDLTGWEFAPAAYSGPAGLSGSHLDVVRSLKLLMAEQRQMEIIQILQRFKKSGNVFVIPDDQSDVMQEFDSLQEEVAKWSAD